MSFLEYQHYYLVGIKGVAMASMAQLLLDAGKTVAGSDVPEDFITQKILSKLPITIDTSFSAELPDTTECVIYTAAHQGTDNAQVQLATSKNIPIYSHAEALSVFFNQKKGIAVCGVGGKSTVSAMITWILEKNNDKPSYSVGVGDILGIGKTGCWNTQSHYFVAEADEYASNASGVQKGEEPVPRFSFLKPFVTVCTHLQFDHPDVYTDEQHTIRTFNTFFESIKEGGTLVYNQQDANTIFPNNGKKISFGESPESDLQYQFQADQSKEGITTAMFTFQGTEYPIHLQVPGAYNIENAAAACLAAYTLGIPLSVSCQSLSDFRSTSRRFEKVGSYKDVPLFDDYAHHPSEIKAVLSALKNWYPTKRKVVAFQPHTFSRTKSLFEDFASSFSEADVLVLLSIFASAREQFDPSISSQQLADAIRQHSPHLQVEVVDGPKELAHFWQTFLKPNDVALTIGAGDIYKAYLDLKTTTPSGSDLLHLFTQHFPNISFQSNHLLAPYTTVKIGGPADIFAEITSQEDLQAVITFANEQHIPVTILGWGANSLISDRGIRGLVIKNATKNITVHSAEETKNALQTYTPIKLQPRWNASAAPETPTYEFTDLNYDENEAEKVLVTMDAGVSLPAAINTLLGQGVTGLQWYSRIPASVGGAIYNNIHGGTHFIGEVLHSVTVLTPDNQVKKYTTDELELDYDYSRFHHSKETILSADFLLFKGNVEQARSTSIEWAKRKQVQPQNSLGCIFQNVSPEEQARLQLPTPSIGYVIQHVLHLQGFSIGKAQVSTRHAAFIENLGGATAQDYLSIIKKISTEAKKTCDLSLKTEIFFLGFTDTELDGIVHSRSNKNTASA